MATQVEETTTSLIGARMEKAAYVKHRHPASGYAVVGVACVVRGGDARIVVGGVRGTPVLIEAAIDAVAEKVPAALAGGALSDTYASGEYRIHLAEVLARCAIAAALAAA